MCAVLAIVLVAWPAGGVAAAEPVAATGSVQASREVFAFFNRAGSDYMLHEADYSVLTTVAFLGINTRADGSLETTSEGTPTLDWAAWTSDWMDEVIGTAHAAGCKVVLGIERFAWSSSERALTVSLLSDSAARARLADEIADAVVARGVDGVNLDFEPIPLAVKDHFVTFVRLLRAELDARQPGLYLTFDATGHPGGYAIGALTAEGAADAVFIMGYPFKTDSSKNAGAVAPLAGVNYGLRETVDTFLAKTSADKVILGLPYYGYEWSTETKKLHSKTRPRGDTYGYPRSQKIGYANDFATVHGRRWDAEQLVAWTRWRYRACPSCPLTWRQLYYDDVQSLGLKYDLVIQRGLGGVGLFKLGNDAGHPELNDLLRDKFGAH